jgi:hypothetical protein
VEVTESHGKEIRRRRRESKIEEGIAGVEAEIVEAGTELSSEV